MKKWKCRESKLVLDHQFMKIRLDKVRIPGGVEKDWIYWDSPDSVMVLGLTKSKKLVMIRQYRYLVDDEVIEFPSGSLHGDEKIEIGAKREFNEETGYRCGKLKSLGAFYETYGQLNRKIHLFFTNEVEITEQELDRGEKGYEEIKIELVDFGEAVKLALENKIVAMGSALAILLLNEKIRKKEVIFD